MNRLPPRKKPGDPVLAADWNALLEAIAARTPRPGAGLGLVATTGGFAYSAQAGALVPRQSLPPFAVIGIGKSASGFEVIVREGWVIERLPKTGDTPTVKFHMPAWGGTALDSTPRPKIPMAIGDTLWCRYLTDAMGTITGAVELVVAVAEQGSTHYQPQDPEGSGQAGTYHVRLFKLEDDGGSPRVKVYQQSDIEHWAPLWTGENLGGGAGVFKEHAEAEGIYRFRTIAEGPGVSVVQNANDEIVIAADVAPAGSPASGKIRLLEGTTHTTLVEADTGAVIAVPTDQIIHVRPYQVCDGGTPVTRKFLTLD